MARLAWLLTLVAGCTAAAQGGKTADDGAGDGGDGEGLEASGSVGGLEKRAVEVQVSAATVEVNRCVERARKDLPYLGGSVDLQITVGRTGRAAQIYFTRSTLGDHHTEACIAKAFRGRSWPRPVGGDVGIVDQHFDFGGGEAEQWSAEKLASAMQAEAETNETPFADLLKNLDVCREKVGAGPLSVTLYLDEDGLCQAAGVGMTDARGNRAIDCLVTAVQTTSFPAPKDVVVKVTLTVGGRAR